jgi:zinc finger protein
VKTSCPVCRAEVPVVTKVENIPYFGEVMLTSVSCECGFKHADYIILGVKEPVRYVLQVNPSTLFSRVIRSTSGTIRIPELGVDIEPGPASQAFITNVEGVFYRIKSVLEMVTRWGEEDKTKKAKELLNTIEEILAGRMKATLIIEDPFGNSAIIGDRVEREPISEEEVRKLEYGMTILDIAGVENEDDLLGS